MMTPTIALISFLLLSHGLWIALYWRRKRTQKLPKNYADRYCNTLLSSVADGVLATDCEGGIVEMNGVASELLGWSVEDALGKPLEGVVSLTDGNSSEKVELDIRGVLTEGKSQCIRELSVLHSKGGTGREVSGKISPIFGDDREVLGVLLVLSDLSNLVLQKTEINQTHQRLDSIYRAAPVGVGLLTNRVFQDVNPLFEQITGYSSDEVVGKKSSFLYATEEEFLRAGEEKYRQIAEFGMGTVETQWKRKNGEIVEILLSSSPIDLDDLNKGVVFTALDLTAQKVAQKESLQSRQRLELALQIGNISICEWIPSEDFFYSDGKLETFLCYEEGNVIYELQSLREKWSILVEEEDQHKIALLDNLKAGELTSVCDCTLRMHTSTGESKWIRAIVKATDFDEAGNPVRYLGIHVDVDQEKRQEHEAFEHREKIMKADKLSTLGTLAAGVAHEINNPNQFILSNINFLEATWSEIREILDQWIEQQGEMEFAGFEYDELRQRYPKALESIKSGSRRIKSIVKELKDYVRENRSDSFTLVDINKIIYSAQILTANLGKKKTDSFRWETNGQLHVRGNNQKLEQVFVNLIMNAFESLGDKTESVTVRSYLNEEHEVVVDVIDEGGGIPPELMDKICDPFFTTKQSEGGTGMGLSVVDSIVKEHGGRLEFVPNESKGTCVRVVLKQCE